MRKTELLEIRIAPAELAELRAAGAMQDERVSTFARNAALAVARSVLGNGIQRREAAGAARATK